MKRRKPTLRLEGYDYAQPGAYFVTIVLARRELLFGHVAGSVVNLSAAGQLVDTHWQRLPNRFVGVALDLYVVMPNHIHGIVVLSETNPQRQTDLSDLVGAFKSSCSAGLGRLLGIKGREWWQRSFYDHIIRDEADLARVRQYIVENPLKWEIDHHNPAVRECADDGDWAVADDEDGIFM